MRILYFPALHTLALKYGVSPLLDQDGSKCWCVQLWFFKAMTRLHNTYLAEFLSWDSWPSNYVFCSWGGIQFRLVWGNATHTTLLWLTNSTEPLVSFSSAQLREKLHLVCQKIRFECLECCMRSLLPPSRITILLERCLEIRVSYHYCLLLKTKFKKLPYSDTLANFFPFFFWFLFP